MVALGTLVWAGFLRNVAMQSGEAEKCTRHDKTYPGG